MIEEALQRLGFLPRMACGELLAPGEKLDSGFIMEHYMHDGILQLFKPAPLGHHVSGGQPADADLSLALVQNVSTVIKRDGSGECTFIGYAVDRTSVAISKLEPKLTWTCPAATVRCRNTLGALIGGPVVRDRTVPTRHCNTALSFDGAPGGLMHH